MSFHTVAYELSQSNAALTAITPVPDPTVVVSGNDIRVPTGLNNIFGAMGLINSAAATLRAQLSSPSLRAVLLHDIGAIVNGLVPGSLPAMNRIWDSPLQLVATESLDFLTQNGAAVMNRGLVWFSDGPRKPTSGKIYTVRGTLAASLVTATWVNSSITFGQVLPAGTYQLVGGRVWSANSVAARFVQPGLAFRPGLPCSSTEAAEMWSEFRYGGLGTWLQFDNVTFPSVDVLGITDTAQVVFMDVIKTA